MLKKNIIIYGYHPIKEAIDSKFIKILIIFINNYKIRKYKLLINKILKKKIPIKVINPKNLNKILNNNNIKNNQGIIAYINFIKNYTLKDIIKYNNKKKILILYNITDTKNIGSIIRSSVCFNVDFIIISKNYYLYNQNIIKISSGAIFKIKICQVKNLINTINFLINNNIKIISITEKGDKNINELSLNKKESFAFILGNEETGIPNNILKISNYKIFIPINKKNITSLNVAIVCGIFLYEINKLL